MFTDEVLSAIPRWVALGADPQEIAEVIGTTVGSLKVTCSREGIPLSGGAISPKTLKGNLTDGQRRKLREAADLRAIPVVQLVLNIITAVVDDSMIDSVLDDLEEEDR